MTMGSGDIEAGWYRQGDSRERYWDGRRWTNRYRDGDEPPPDPADQSPKDLSEDRGASRSASSLLGWIVGGALVVTVAICCSGIWGDEDGDDIDEGAAALVACEDAVRGQIKNPSTADFSWLDQTITETSISGEVTAQNDFGGEKTLRYQCAISGSSVTSATVNEL